MILTYLRSPRPTSVLETLTEELSPVLQIPKKLAKLPHDIEVLLNANTHTSTLVREMLGSVVQVYPIVIKP